MDLGCRRDPLAITLTFLIASPLVSEIAAIMIGDQFGWDIAAAYVLTGSILSMAIGWVLSHFDLGRWVDPMVQAGRVASLRADGHVPSLSERVAAAQEEAIDIFRGVWIRVLAGVGIGGGVVPIAEALWSKGMSLGTVMALVMSSIALSIPQAMMLSRVMRPPLLVIFFSTVAAGIVIIGFNLFA